MTNLDRAKKLIQDQCIIQGFKLPEDSYIFKMMELASKTTWYHPERDELPDFEKCDSIIAIEKDTIPINIFIAEINKKWGLQCYSRSDDQMFNMKEDITVWTYLPKYKAE